MGAYASTPSTSAADDLRDQPAAGGAGCARLSRSRPMSRSIASETPMPNSAGMVTAMTENAANRKMPRSGSLSMASPAISSANSAYSASGSSSTGIATPGLRIMRMNS